MATWKVEVFSPPERKRAHGGWGTSIPHESRAEGRARDAFAAVKFALSVNLEPNSGVVVRLVCDGQTIEETRCS